MPAISNQPPPVHSKFEGVKNFVKNVWQPWNAEKGHRAAPTVGFVALSVLTLGLFAIPGVVSLVKRINQIGKSSPGVQKSAQTATKVFDSKIRISMLLTTLKAINDEFTRVLNSSNPSQNQLFKLLESKTNLERKLANLGYKDPFEGVKFGPYMGATSSTGNITEQIEAEIADLEEHLKFNEEFSGMDESTTILKEKLREAKQRLEDVKKQELFAGVEFGSYQGSDTSSTGNVIDDLRAKIADLEENLRFDEEFGGTVNRDFLNAEKNRLGTLEGLNKEIASLKDFIAGLDSRIAKLPTEETLASLQEGSKEYEEALTQFLEKASLEQEKVNFENSLDQMIKGLNALAATPSSVAKEVEISTETSKPIVRVGKPHSNYGEGSEETDAMILTSEKLGTIESEEPIPEKTVFEQAKEKMGGFVKSVSDFAQEKINAQEAKTAWANRMAEAKNKSEVARILYEQIEDLEAKVNKLESVWSSQKETTIKDAIQHANNVIEGKVDVENYDPSHWIDIRNKAMQELGHLNNIHWELENAMHALADKRKEWDQMMQENK